MVDPTIRERLREQGHKLVNAHHWVSKTGRPWSLRMRSDACAKCGQTPDLHLRDHERPGYICITGPDALAVVADLDTLERRAIAAEEALERLSDVGWVLARITPEGERIEPPDGTWHDLDAALEQARAALEASRGSA